MSLILQALKKAKALAGSKAPVRGPGYLQSFGFGQKPLGNRGGKLRRILVSYVLPAILIATALAYGVNYWSARSRAKLAATKTAAIVSAPESPALAPELAASAEQAVPEAAPAETPKVAEAKPVAPPSVLPPVRRVRPVPTVTPEVVRLEPTPVPEVDEVKDSAAASNASPKPPVTPEPEVSTRDPFELAVFFQRSGENQKALEQYKRVLDRDPINQAALSNLGVLYLAMGNLVEAIRTLRSATYANQNYDKAHNNLGIALMQDGQNAEATREFERALQLNSKNTEALTNLGILSTNAGKPDQAVGYYLQALQLNAASLETHYNIAQIYERQGDYRKAVDHYRQFLVLGSSQHPDRAKQVEIKIQELLGKRQP